MYNQKLFKSYVLKKMLLSVFSIIIGAFFLITAFWSLNLLLTSINGEMARLSEYNEILQQIDNEGLHINGTSVVLDGNRIYLESLQDVDLWGDKIKTYSFYLLFSLFFFIICNFYLALNLSKNTLKCLLLFKKYKLISKNSSISLLFCKVPAIVWLTPLINYIPINGILKDIVHYGNRLSLEKSISYRGPNLWHMKILRFISLIVTIFILFIIYLLIEQNNVPNIWLYIFSTIYVYFSIAILLIIYKLEQFLFDANKSNN